MRRVAVCGLALLAIVAALGCGSGDKRSQQAAPTTPPQQRTPTATFVHATATPDGSRSRGQSEPDLFGLLLGSGLSAGSDGTLREGDYEPGDPALEAYVLKQSDLPPGYRLVQTLNSRVSDGISESGKADLAASIASDGDFESGRGSMLLSMVMRFSDLQDLESAFSDIDADAVRAQLESAGGSEWAGLFDDVHTLDTGDLGDHATGLGMTMDLASLFGSVAEALGGPTGTPVAIPSGVPTGFGIDMYIFARGSYAGALMRVFTSGARPLDELALARVVDGRLSAAD